MRAALALLIFCLPVSPQASSRPPLAKKIDSILNSPAARQCFWGIHVIDARTGAVVYQRNENNFFVPASNAKLFSTSLALMRLGPGYRFHTVVSADSRPDEAGRVREIRLIGGGDPNLSGRIIPYQRDQTRVTTFEVIEKLADAVVASGVKWVEEDLVGDDTAYLWEPYPDGWAVDDPTWEYGAPVSALTLNDSAFSLLVDPATEEGLPASVSLKPPLEHLTIHNRTQTIVSGPNSINVQRLPGSSELTVSGTIAINASSDVNILAVDDPAEFAAHALRDALLGRGVRIGGRARALHRRVDDPASGAFGVELARHTSQPLIEAIRVINKVSQNLHAEMVLREVARAKDGVGSRKRGIEELTGFLDEIGVPRKQYRFEDGSGLSRLTLVSPATIVRLLQFMDSTPHREAWISTLPIAGEDGTLYTRFDKRPRPGIRAKTGTLSHISSLAGYASRTNGQRYIFAIMANNYNTESSSIRRLIDRIALALLN